MTERALIVGAGVSGLSLGRQLTIEGYTATVLDKGRRPGGRCATRTVEGQPVDHGVAMLHGKSEVFTSAVARSAPDGLMLDWPAHLRGTGTPCQPQAFDPQTWRVGLTGGVAGFAAWLGHGLEVQQRTRVLGLEVRDDRFAVKLEDPPESWGPQLLQAAADQLGDWVKAPAWQQHHRWRYARVSRENLLQLPALLRWPGGARLGLCGEAFNPAGGVEGAYLSGRELARRMVNNTETSV